MEARALLIDLVNMRASVVFLMDNYRSLLMGNICRSTGSLYQRARSTNVSHHEQAAFGTIANVLQQQSKCREDPEGSMSSVEELFIFNGKQGAYRIMQKIIDNDGHNHWLVE